MRGKKLFSDRKGLSEFILHLVSVLIFISALFIFFIIFKLYSINKVKNELKTISDSQLSSINLMNFLRTEVNTDGKKISMSELMGLWYYDNNKYSKLLKENADEVLNNMEFEYLEPKIKGTAIRAFQVNINKEGISVAEFKSKSFDNGFCILSDDICVSDTSACYTKDYACANLGEAVIPISNDNTLYIFMKEAYNSYNPK